MVPTQTLENFPPFGDNATKVQPDNAKYAAGFQPSDVYPAEWVNWVWGKSSNGVTKLNAGVDMMEREINNVLAGADKTPDATKDNQLLQAIQKLISDAKAQAILAAHPVGSLYWSSQSTDPGTLFGGTWTRIKDKFILAAGDTYTNGATGGAATVTLTVNNMPSHSHTIGGNTGSTQPTFTGTEHSHSYTPAGSISVKTNPTFTGSAVTSGASSAANTGSESSHTHDMQHYHSRGTMEITGQITNSSGTFHALGFEAKSGAFSGAFSGGSYSGYSRQGQSSGHEGAKVINFTASNGWTGLTSNSLTSASAAKNSTGAGSSHSHTMAHTHSVTASGTISGGAYTFTGTAATLKATAGGTVSSHTHTLPANTGSNGSGTAVDKMPPYLVKYCWERVS